LPVLQHPIILTAEGAETAEEYRIHCNTRNQDLCRFPLRSLILVPPLCGGTRIFDALRRAGSYSQVLPLIDWTQSVATPVSPQSGGTREHSGRTRKKNTSAISAAQWIDDERIGYCVRRSRSTSICCVQSACDSFRSTLPPRKGHGCPLSSRPNASHSLRLLAQVSHRCGSVS
jgi:hypothetical protein